MKFFLLIVLLVAEVDVAVPLSCFSCVAPDAVTCLTSPDLLQNQSCAQSCGSAKIKYSDSLSGKTKSGVFYGCIDCADNKTGCAAVGRSLNKTLLECQVKCCNGLSYCNNPVVNPLQCNYCTGPSSYNCPIYSQSCALSPKSLGASQCGSAVGKYMNENGLKRDVFYRGCFDNVGKRAACFALGGYLKGDESNIGKYTLLNCEIKLCSGKYCNTWYDPWPKLSPSAITVFTPTVSGPTQCRQCLQNNKTTCFENLQTQVCSTNPFSLGTTHCGSAVGKYRDSKGNVVDGFFRGCINCEDKKAACAAVGGLLKSVRGWTQLECEIECCTGENCNTLIPGGSNGSKTPRVSGKDKHASMSGILVFTTAFASIITYHV